MYYRPEEWDELDEVAIAWIDSRNLRPALDFIVDTMKNAWQYLDSNGIDFNSGEDYDDYHHPLNAIYSLAWDLQKQAFGAYEVLMILANSDEAYGASRAIYNWGHYGVFY